MMVFLFASLAIAGIPSSADLSSEFEKLQLPICAQNGPWCWAYTTIGVLEFEASRKLRHRVQLSPGYLAWAARQTDSQGSGGSNFGLANRGIDAYGTVNLNLGGEPKGNRIPRPSQETVQTSRELGDLEFHWIRFWNREEMPRRQLEAIKQDIADGHPVAVGMQWPNNTAFVPNSNVLAVPPKDQIFDGHCVILVGYKDDPTMPGGGAFRFRNSWGSDWADKGSAWMPYELLNFCINDAFSVRINSRQDSVGGSIYRYKANNVVASAAKPEALSLQDMTQYGRAWGTDPQIRFSGSKLNDRFDIKFNVPKSGRFRVRVVITRGEDYGQFSVQFPGREVSKVIEGAGPGVSRSQPIDLGDHTFRAGETSLSFVLRGQSPASRGLGIGLSEIQLVERS